MEFLAVEPDQVVARMRVELHKCAPNGYLHAGAVVSPSVCDGIIRSRARRLIDLFHRRGLLSRSLKFFAALGDVHGVRACLDTNGDDLAAVNEAFLCACSFQHTNAAALLLDRSIMLDAELGRRIDGGPGRSAFIQTIVANSLAFTNADPAGPWQASLRACLHCSTMSIPSSVTRSVRSSS